MDDPAVVSRNPGDEWLTARQELLAKEKEFTRLRDALNTERRRLPITGIDKEYAFEARMERRACWICSRAAASS